MMNGQADLTVVVTYWDGLHACHFRRTERSRSVDTIRTFIAARVLVIICTNCRCMTTWCIVATENVERTDLSHPIHSDNCVMQPDNTCLRVPPAYTSRDYRLAASSILPHLRNVLQLTFYGFKTHRM